MLMLQGLGPHLHVDIVGHEGEPHQDVHFDVCFLEVTPASQDLDLALLRLTHSLELPGVATRRLTGHFCRLRRRRVTWLATCCHPALHLQLHKDSLRHFISGQATRASAFVFRMQ